MNAPVSVQRYRTIWISDLHLGVPGCRADLLADFLRNTDSDHLYLVGDVVDGWRLRRSWYWPKQHDDVLQSVLAKARRGTTVIYTPGNHDEFARQYLGRQFGNVLVQGEAIHTTADGRRLLVVHGDAFDGAVKYARRLAPLDHWGSAIARTCNQGVDLARRRLGYSRWSLSTYLKHKVKSAVRYVAEFERATIEAAKARGLDGIVCGHIHHAALREIDGIQYCNDGDWLESCTGLVEHHDGRLEILHWADRHQLSLGHPAFATIPAE